jgi:hypothetical protein
MQTTAKVILSLGTSVLVIGSTAAVRAQYYYRPFPPQPPPYGYYAPPPLPRYGYYPQRWHTWNGCPPYYTVQDGVCKPYRGY